MERLKNLFRKDRIYAEQLEEYTAGDTVIALIYYAAILVLYYIMGRILSSTGVYLGIIVSLVFIVIPALRKYIRIHRIPWMY